MVLDQDTMIGDILDRSAACQEVFLSMGMPCTSCPAARGETVAEACALHDVDVNLLLERLRAELSRQ